MRQSSTNQLRASHLLVADVRVRLDSRQHLEQLLENQEVESIPRPE